MQLGEVGVDGGEPHVGGVVEAAEDGERKRRTRGAVTQQELQLHNV